MQNQMVILRGVLEVKFTKYCTCAAKNPGELKEYSQEWTGFFIILELEPYMLKAYLGNYSPFDCHLRHFSQSGEVFNVIFELL